VAVVITEKQLEELCAGLLPGEEVLAVGLFEPYGSGVAIAGGASTGVSTAHALHVPGAAGALMSAAAGYAAERGLAAAEHQPPWTVLGVTAAHVYAFDASDRAGVTATKSFSGPPYASWDRGAIAVHVSRALTSFHLSVDDPSSGTTWEFKGNSIYKVGGKLVAHLLTETAS
jgi:hypothetical protein